MGKELCTSIWCLCHRSVHVHGHVNSYSINFSKDVEEVVIKRKTEEKFLEQLYFNFSTSIK